MPIIAKNEGSAFKPAPEGQWAAVCCDVVDLGILKSEWKGKVKEQHKIRIVFQIEELMDSGQPYTVSSQFTLTMYENGNLRPFLESWRGRPYTEDEAKRGIDVELLIGHMAVVQVVHAERGGKTYANIQSIMKPMRGMQTFGVSPEYVRVKDRAPVAATGSAAQSDEGAPPHDDSDGCDLPF